MKPEQFSGHGAILRDGCGTPVALADEEVLELALGNKIMTYNDGYGITRREYCEDTQ